MTSTILTRDISRSYRVFEREIKELKQAIKGVYEKIRDSPEEVQNLFLQLLKNKFSEVYAASLRIDSYKGKSGKDIRAILKRDFSKHYKNLETMMTLKGNETYVRVTSQYAETLEEFAKRKGVEAPRIIHVIGKNKRNPVGDAKEKIGWPSFPFAQLMEQRRYTESFEAYVEYGIENVETDQGVVEGADNVSLRKYPEISYSLGGRSSEGIEKRVKELAEETDARYGELLSEGLDREVACTSYATVARLNRKTSLLGGLATKIRNWRRKNKGKKDQRKYDYLRQLEKIT